jgi:hypothetical protein
MRKKNAAGFFATKVDHFNFCTTHSKSLENSQYMKFRYSLILNTGYLQNVVEKSIIRDTI